MRDSVDLSVCTQRFNVPLHALLAGMLPWVIQICERGGVV